MKKLMAATIILLPLLILAILLVSGAIANLVTHIYVETVEFVDGDMLVLVLDDEEAPPTVKCEVNVLPLRASNRGITFGSDDESIVTIDGEGFVTAKYFGETYISVSSDENKAAVDKRKVLVTDNTVHYVIIKPFDDDMYKGESQRLLAATVPSEANNNQIKWSSSDPDVLSVSLSGEVTCHGAGEVTITATSVDKPDIKDEVTITCHEQLKSIAVEGGVQSVLTVVREEQFPTVIPTPADATYSLSYSSSDETVATVDKSGAITFKKEGYAVITATAVDGRGNESSVSVAYSCADGYFMGALFNDTRYSVDYDEFAGRTLESVISLKKDPVGSYRQILEVIIDRNDLVTFDMETETFRLENVGDETRLGEVHITVKAKKYSDKQHALVETVSDVCTIDVTRKTQSVSFRYGGTSLSEISVTDVAPPTVNVVVDEELEGSICIIATPANHTDKIVYTLTGDAATKTDGGALDFGEEGSVELSAGAGDTVFENKFKVQYVHLEPSDKLVEVKPTEDAPKQEITVVLDESVNNGVLEVAAPEGTKPQYDIISDTEGVLADDVISFDPETKTFVKKRGGFVTITVSFVPDAEGRTYAVEEDMSVTVHIYVDMPLGVDNVSLILEDGQPIPEGYWTEKESVAFKVVLGAYSDREGKPHPQKNAVTPDFLEGKKVYVNDVEVTPDEEQDIEGKLVFSVVKDFIKDSETLKVVIVYDEKAREYFKSQGDTKTNVLSTTREVHTTRGKLRQAPKITVRDGAAFEEKGNKLEFHDIGYAVTLDVTVTLDPADFVLTSDKIALPSGSCFTSEVQIVDDTHAVITLTAKDGGVESAALNVAGHTFGISEVKVNALADTVGLKFAGKPLRDGLIYTTLRKSLDFEVLLSRADGKRVTVNSARYSLGEDGGNDVATTGGKGSFSVSLLDAEQKSLTVTAGDSGSFSLSLQRVLLSSLIFDKLHVVYPHDGAIEELDGIPFGDGAAHRIYLPKTNQGALDLYVTVPLLEESEDTHVLGGFDATADDEELTSLFRLTLPDEDGWNDQLSVVQYGGEYAIRFSVGFPKSGGGFAGKQVTFGWNENEVELLLNYVVIANIFFKGYDSNDKSNGGDVYKGYQQTRVFAKHSDYGNGKVDYLRVPLSAISDTVLNTQADPSTISWTLSGVNSYLGTEEVISSQSVFDVIYDGASYTIAKSEQEGGHSTLLDADGNVVCAGGKYADGKTQVPWVDVYAEAGYAYIYFGNFNGLSEVDVQNDYFGNFDEKADYAPKAKIVKDEDGRDPRDVEPSAYAYSFMRVKAGDNAEGGVNAHFNFNVMQEDALVNVFNAAGYYAYDRIVLQENLYGPGELGAEGTKYDYAIQNDLFLNSASLNKGLIYGNGYQVNFEAKNAAMGQYSESDGIAVQRAYNTVIKCSNPNEEISSDYQRVVLKMEYAYYCDLSYYYKFNPSVGIFYTKNTVFSYIPKTAIQLYYNGNKLYAENIVMTECGTSVQADNGNGQNIEIYYKGFVDILNYFNFSALGNLNPLIGLLFYQVVPAVKDYFEWHGKRVYTDLNDMSGDLYSIYVDVLAFAASDLSGKTFIFSDGGYKPLSENDSLSDNEKVVCKNLAFSYFALTYEMMSGGNRLDKATVNMENDRFTGTADMNELFSDDRYIRLQCEYKDIDVKNYDHIKWHMQQVYRDTSVIGNRLSHTEDLRQSLKGTTWKDGSGVDGEGRPFGPSAAAYNLLETPLPVKREHAA